MSLRIIAIKNLLLRYAENGYDGCFLEKKTGNKPPASRIRQYYLAFNVVTWWDLLVNVSIDFHPPEDSGGEVTFQVVSGKLFFEKTSVLSFGYTVISCKKTFQMDLCVISISIRIL